MKYWLWLLIFIAGCQTTLSLGLHKSFDLGGHNMYDTPLDTSLELKFESEK